MSSIGGHSWYPHVQRDPNLVSLNYSCTRMNTLKRYRLECSSVWNFHHMEDVSSTFDIALLIPSSLIQGWPISRLFLVLIYLTAMPKETVEYRRAIHLLYNVKVHCCILLFFTQQFTFIAKSYVYLLNTRKKTVHNFDCISDRDVQSLAKQSTMLFPS